jgi:hypothetical protein
MLADQPTTVMAPSAALATVPVEGGGKVGQWSGVASAL